MPSNQGFTLSYNGQNGWIPLYPSTLQSQVIDWGLGECFGPYQVTLSATSWQNNQQTVTLNGVIDTDILYCTKVLSGTELEMKAQNTAYGLLDPYIGINSLNNQIQFTCNPSSPTVDLTVQVSWSR